MRKVIAIGESILDTVFKDDKPESTFVGGRVANAAASAASAGIPVTMVSECCNDHVGNIIVNHLKNHNVDTSSIDRFTDGSTAISLIFNNDGKKNIINYTNYPTDRFDVVWPRIDEDDIILFGSFYSIDTALRERMYELLHYAFERKAIMIYFLGCQHGINCRITKVMPAILENLEMSSIVIANRTDLEAIFPGESADQAFKNHIEFYSSNFIYINDDFSLTIYRRSGEKIHYPSKPTHTPESFLGWQSGLAAGLTYAIFYNNLLFKKLDNVDSELMNSILDMATEFAQEAANHTHCINAQSGLEKSEHLKRALSGIENNS